MKKIIIIALSMLFIFSLMSCQPESLNAKNLWSEKKPKLSENSKTVTLPSFETLAEVVTPSVVNISTTQVVKNNPYNHFFGPKGRQRGQDPFNEFFGDDFFEKFFGGPRNESQERSALGSGFILNEDGYVVTNCHVIKDASKVKVILANEKEYDDVEIIGCDQKTDVALVKIKSKDKFKPVSLGNSDNLKAGQWVVAIGNPFGLGHSITSGIVSFIGREIQLTQYDNFIQTDASINPGNSGGPLLNTDGQVIGINTAILASGQGIGFAIPVNLAKNIIKQLLETGKITRGWLGIFMKEIDDVQKEVFGFKDKTGILVHDVVEDSPAEKAGFKPGDVIIEYNGKAIEKAREFSRQIANTSPGTKVEFTVLRGGNKINIKAEIAKMEDEEEITLAKKDENMLGLKVRNLNNDDKSKYGIKEGIFVTEVANNSPFSYQVQASDVILKVNKTSINSIRDFSKAISSLKKGDGVVLLILRDGHRRMFVSTRIE
ncbi:MAG: Do family serine endopeptidase [Pseudomonadota bacterium]